MNAYLRHYISSSVFHLARSAGASRRLAMLAKQHLPYCLMPLPGDRYIVVNREYKPLGWPPNLREFVHYDDPAFAALTVPAAELHLDGKADVPIMLYTPPDTPWRASCGEKYRQRLIQVFGPMTFDENGDRTVSAGAAA